MAQILPERLEWVKLGSAEKSPCPGCAAKGRRPVATARSRRARRRPSSR